MTAVGGFWSMPHDIHRQTRQSRRSRDGAWANGGVHRAVPGFDACGKSVSSATTPSEPRRPTMMPQLSATGCGAETRPLSSPTAVDARLAHATSARRRLPVRHAHDPARGRRRRSGVPRVPRRRWPTSETELPRIGGAWTGRDAGCTDRHRRLRSDAREAPSCSSSPTAPITLHRGDSLVPTEHAKEDERRTCRLALFISALRRGTTRRADSARCSPGRRWRRARVRRRRGTSVNDWRSVTSRRAKNPRSNSRAASSV